MDTRRRLIVNADDYNTDSERNRGIIEAARNGIVSSASVLTNMGGLAEALEALGPVLGSAIGVHLNLTRGMPLSSQVPSLTGPRGNFLPKAAAWRRALQGGYSPHEIMREWSAQIEAFCRSGRHPDHLDSNNHLHVFPGCVRVLAGLARRFNIRRVRLPLEPMHIPSLMGRSGLKRFCMALLCVRARSLFRASGLWMPDTMFGIAFPDTTDSRSLCRFLRTLPAGTHELMCHPGYAAPGARGFSCAAREKELSALTCAAVRGAVCRESIHLMSFEDAG